MRNERRAGRKPRISDSDLLEINNRKNNGESIAHIAKELGVSRQAVYSRLKSSENNETLKIDYIVDGDCATRIYIDTQKKDIRIENMLHRISTYAFGLSESPLWQDFSLFLEKIYLESLGIDVESNEKILWINEDSNRFSINDVLEKSDNKIKVEDGQSFLDEKVFVITKQDILYSRTDTDGFQPKALSKDRKWFIKVQATISGKQMDDWKVEIIASDICKQLGIPCVEQKMCNVVYLDKTYKAVYSKNYELDGFEFLSFESLINNLGLSTYDKEFITRDANEKLIWCAQKLTEASNIPYEETLKYMIDLAVVDCLVGNVDRHTRNFGLFYDSISNEFKIPLLFDNGMGLFEHDSYRDEYKTFDEAMRNVYVSPYGEDPFDMIKLLDDKYGLNTLYPEIKNIRYVDLNLTSMAREYIRRIQELLKDLKD